MTPLHHVCSFVLQRKDKDGPSYLVCRVKWDCCRSVVVLSTGFVVDPERWDRKASRCAPRSFHGPRRVPAAVINAETDRFRVAAGEVFSDLSARGVWPTADEVRRGMREALGIDAPSSASSAPTADAFARFMADRTVSRSWKEGTVKKMRTVGQHIAGFAPFRTTDGFTSENLTAYIVHLRSEGMCDTTIHRQVGYLKWFLKWADERRLVRCRDWMTFSPKLRQSVKPVVFLTWAELMRLDSWKGGQYREDIRDMFLFSCYTSLRWSDVSSLRWSQVSPETVSVVAVKTGEPLVIELNRWSQDILSRMVDRDFGRDRVFPDIPNQVANRYLKEIAAACGIDGPVTLTRWEGGERRDETRPKHELLTFHAGRRTFICQSLLMGIPPTTVMQWTGHSDYDAMKPYIAVTDEGRRDAMRSAWDESSYTIL